MLFKKKQEEPKKPNKIKIEMSLERCKDSIQGLLDQYAKNEQDYMRKMVAMKKEGRLSEADRYKEKLRLVYARQAKMNDLMDQVEQFGYMIDEAFAKNDVYQSLGMVLGEANKVSVSPELKKLLADVKQFEDVFTKGLNKMDTIFGKVSRTVSDVNDSTTNTFDAEIEARVNARIEQADQQTTLEAEADKSLFDDVLSLN